jgi:hypothetical protein
MNAIISPKAGLVYLSTMFLVISALAFLAGSLQISGRMEAPEGVPYWGRYFLLFVGLLFLMFPFYFYRVYKRRVKRG